MNIISEMQNQTNSLVLEKSSEKKQTQSASNASIPLVSLTDRSAEWKINMRAALALSGPVSVINLFKRQTDSSLECAFNKSIKNSKFASFYGVMLSVVTEAMGPQADLNWRWFDPNLLLSELKLHEFGTVDWYNDVDENSTNPKLNLNNIQAIYSRLPNAEKLDILKRSVIEPMDAYLAVTNNNKGMDAEEIGDLRKASSEYQDALGLDPHCLLALYNYAEMMCSGGHHAKGEKCLNKLLQLDPDNAKAWGMRAMCFEGSGNFTRAIECYETARRIDNTSETRLRNFALLMVEKQHNERAKALYEELIDMNPRNGIAIGEYADLLHTMDLKPEAVAAFEQAIATQNFNNTVVNDYAVLLRKMGLENNDPALVQKARGLLHSITDPNIFERMNQMKF